MPGGPGRAAACARAAWSRVVVAGVMLAVLAGCAEVAEAPLSERRVRVVATTGMIADVAARVGGDRVEVHGLMGPGVDPHLYKASEGDVRRLTEADLILYNGLHLEARMADVLERVSGRIRTVAVTRGIERGRLLSPPEFEGAYDPHVWFDVRLWMRAVEAICDALSELDPDHGEVYASNAERYLSELSALHEELVALAETLAPERRVLVTAHDAFNYFGRAYGFEVRGLQGISTATEAGTADVQALAAFIAERGVPALFVESSVPVRTIEAVRAAARARGHEVGIGGELYSDALGDAGTGADSYVGMVRHNMRTIVGALHGGGVDG